MTKLIQNAIYIPEDDLYLVSTHTHDFVTHVFKDGSELSLDGGPSYARRVGDLNKLDDEGRYQEYCLTDEDAFEGYITDRLLWGTRGKDGKQPLTYRPIKELAARPEGLGHMTAILANCPTIGPWHRRVVEYWIDALTGQPG